MTREGLFPAALQARYLDPRLIGEGAMGLVFAAKDSELNRPVAVKVIAACLGSDPDRQRFVRESLLLASLSHPGVVRLFDAGLSGPSPYLVMALLQGETLAGRIAAGLLGADEVARLLGSALDALDHVHRHGILHRDLKPSNVFLDAQAGPVLIDFGLARRPDTPGPTQPGFVLGSLRYLAPELVTGSPATVQSDLYGLALCGLEALTGVDVHANPGEVRATLEQIMSSLCSGVYHEAAARALRPHGRLGRLLLRALAQDSGDRPGSAADFARELAAVANASTCGPHAAPAPGQKARGPAVAPPSGYPPRRGPIFGPAVLLSSLVLALLFLFVLRQMSGGMRGEPPAPADRRVTGSLSGEPKPIIGTARATASNPDAACLAALTRLSGRPRPSELSGQVKRLTASLMFETRNSLVSATARSVLATSGLDALGSVPLPVFRTPGPASDELLYQHLFWRHALARLAAPDDLSALGTGRLFPGHYRPGAMPPTRARVFSLPIRRQTALGLERRAAEFWLDDLAVPVVTRHVWTLNLDRVNDARQAWVMLRVERAQWPEILRVSVGGRCTLHPVVSPEDGKCFAHSVPLWALREGENRFEVGVEALMGSNFALRGLRTFEVALLP